MKPILDRVIIKQEKPEEKTKGGLILPEVAKQAKPTGVIVSIGGKVEEVKVGDRVLFNANYHQQFFNPDDGEDYVTINEADVLAVLSHNEHYAQLSMTDGVGVQVQ